MKWYPTWKLIQQWLCHMRALGVVGGWLVWGLWATGIGSLHAQHLPMRHYTVDEGLAQNDVSCGYQDRQGYLWWGTYSGLSRFDGKNFVTFNQENNRLGGNVIKDIVEDAQNRLWVGYNGGIARLEDRQFINYQQGFLGTDVISLWPDPQQGLWLLTDQGVSYFNGETFINYPMEGINPSYLKLLTGTPERTIWVGTEKGLYRWTPQIPEFLPVSTVNFPLVALQYHPTEQQLYLIDSQAFYHFQEDRLFKILDSPLTTPLTNFTIGKGGVFWVHSSSEVWRWTSAGSKIYGKMMLEEASISHVLEDREHNLWLLRWGGLSRILHEQILSYTQGLPGKIVTSVTKDAQGMLWITGEHGAIRLTEAGEIKLHLPQAYVETAWIDPERAMFATENGIRIYDYQGQLLQTWGNSISFNNIIRDKQGLYWMASYAGLYSTQHQKFELVMDSSQGLGSNVVWALLEDHAGQLWVGTENGISRLQEGRWTHFDQRHGLSHQSIWSLLDDDYWGLLVGTERGLNRFQNGKFERLPFLSERTINGMVVDQDQRLWLSTEKGLFRVTQRQKVDLFLDKSRGLVGNATYNKSLFQDAQAIYVGTYGGLTRVEKEIEASQSVEPLLKISGLEVNQVSRELSFLESSLEASQNNLVIYFNAIYMYAPESITYRYQLEGMDTDWRPGSRVNQAVYTNLPPGNYRFQVQAFAEDQKRSAVQSLKFRIEPAFWQRWWFVVLEGLTVLGVLGGLGRFLLSRAARERARLEATVASRTQDLHKTYQEISHITQVMQAVNATLDLDTVMQAVIEALQTIFKFDHIHIQLLDEEQAELRLVKTYGQALTGENVQKLMQGSLPLKENTSFFVDVILQNRRFYLPRITPEQLINMFPRDQAAYRLAPAKGYLCYPLRVQNHPIGVLSFANHQDFLNLSEEQLARIELYLTHIAIAINNAYLYADLKTAKEKIEKHTKQLEDSHRVIHRQNQIFRSLLETSTSMEQTEELSELFEYTLMQLKKLFWESDFGMILNGERWEIIECAAFQGFSEEEQQRIIEYQLKLLEMHDLSALLKDLTPVPSVAAGIASKCWVLPMTGRERKLIGKLIIRGPELDRQAVEIIGIFLEQVAAVSENKLLKRQLEKLASTDPLTGTYNRSYFESEMNKVMQTAQRFPDVAFSVILIDVNGLKRVNDIFGHQEGDRMIIQVAELLHRICRKTDVITRLGGDEFVVLCPATNSEQAIYLKERLRQAEATEQIVCVHHDGTQETVPIRMSIGVASSDEWPPMDLMKVADSAMYQDKQAFYATRQRYR